MVVALVTHCEYNECTGSRYLGQGLGRRDCNVFRDSICPRGRFGISKRSFVAFHVYATRYNAQGLPLCECLPPLF
jgi:hypothetical protein